MINTVSDRADSRQDQTAQSLEVAHLYYRKGQSQKQIAMILGLSQPKVSRLLGIAQRSGLIHVTIHAPREKILSDAVQELLSPWGVMKVSVNGYSRIHVGQATADFIAEFLRARPDATLVIDGGMTVGEMVVAFSPTLTTSIRVVPICADPSSYAVSAVALAARLAAKCPFVNDVKIPQFTGTPLLEEHRNVKAIAALADIVILGVGPWTSPFTALEFVRHLGKNPLTIQRNNRDVIAAAGYCPIGRDFGLKTIPEIDDLMPRALSFYQIKRFARERHTVVILLAHSAGKCDAVLAAVRARLCNTLFIDEDLARAIVATLSHGNR